MATTPPKSNTEILQDLAVAVPKLQASLDRIEKAVTASGVPAETVKGWVKDALREGTA